MVEAGAIRLGVHLPVLDPPRHAGRDNGRPGAQGGRAGALRAPRRPAGRDLAGKRTGSSSAREVRGARRTPRHARMPTTHRLSGRAEDSRLVHFEVPPHSDIPRPGDVVTVTVIRCKALLPARRLAGRAPLDDPSHPRRRRVGSRRGRELRRARPRRRRGAGDGPRVARAADAARRATRSTSPASARCRSTTRSDGQR